MTRKEYQQLLEKDLEVYGRPNLFVRILGSQIRFLRLFRRCQYYSQFRILRPYYYYCRFSYRRYSTKIGIDIPSRVRIGGGFRVFHPNGIVTNSLTQIGENFTIAGGSKIGIKESGKAAKIGNNVTIGINCTIIGDVTIGDNALIGAGAVVVKDVPENAIVAGNPARVIGWSDKKGLL